MSQTSNNSNRFPNSIKNDTIANINTQFTQNFEEKSISGAGISTQTRHNVNMSCNLLEFNEVCSLLKIGRTTLYSLVNNKSIKAVKLLGRTLFRESDVYNFISALPEYEGGPNGF